MNDKMDKALHLVARKLSESGHNSKPVLLHSFRIGEILYKNNYEEDIVISGILHDLIEDTDTTKEEIEKLYGKKIAKIVESVSFNPSIKDKLEQSKEMFERAKEQGREALLVKCADLIDNIDYVHLSKDKEKLLKKYKLFLDISKDYIEKEPIYKELLKKYIEQTISLH